MHDCLIIGGGVVGLSLAYELAGAGLSVHLVERGQLGREASWAGAGLLPPALSREGASAVQLDPMQQLEAVSHEMHRAWAADLREATGLDTGYRRTGGMHIVGDSPNGPQIESDLRTAMADRRRLGIEVRELSTANVKKMEPSLAPVSCAFLLPDECQIRNPRHLKALAAAATLRGVQITTGVEATDLVVRGGRIDGVATAQGVLQADRYCICGGPWSATLLARVGCRVEMRPVRGQMLLVQTSPTLLRRIVNEGPRYVVPRGDGRYLVGSTVEDAGFDCRTTAAGIGGLLEFAQRLVPALGDAQLERSWAGLRPGSVDGLPYLGRVPNLSNLFVAAGHFRAGLHLSTGTARVMSQLMRDLAPEIDLTPFRPDRIVS
jgi:glycine oxidase